MAEIELRAQFVDQASEGVSRLADKLKELGTAYLGFEGIKKLVENITEAQEATLELDRLFRSFGDTVGVTKQNMIDYATTIQNTTAISDEAVLKGQAALLKYTSVTGKEFERVRALTVDVASTMGGDVAGAADMLGRALENPIQGMRILRQLGIVLSPEQMALAKNMVETGRAAQVQAFLLAELEKRYKGAAKEGVETLGGALTQLKNKITDAFEGQSSNVDTLTDAIHDLSDEVSKQEFRDALASMVTLFVNIASTITRAVTAISKFNEEIKLLDNPVLNALLKAIPGVNLLPNIVAANSEIKTLTSTPGSAASTPVIPGEGDDGGLRSFLSKIYGNGNGLKGPTLETATERLARLKKELEEMTSQTKNFLSMIQEAYDSTLTTQQKIAQTNEKIGKDLRFLVDNNVYTEQEATAQAVELFQEDLDKAANSASGRRMTFPKEEVTEYQRLAREAAKSITAAFADMFENMGNGANGFLRTILGVFRKIVAEAAALDLAKLLKIDQFGQGGGGGGGSNLGGLFKTVAGFFGFAGGTSQLNGPAIVGENGPELFIPPGFGGSIVPNYAMAGGGVNYSPITNIQASEGTDMNKLMGIIAINNDRQRAELLRMFERNGFGRLR